MQLLIVITQKKKTVLSQHQTVQSWTFDQLWRLEDTRHGEDGSNVFLFCRVLTFPIPSPATRTGTQKAAGAAMYGEEGPGPQARGQGNGSCWKAGEKAQEHLVNSSGV